MSTVSRTIRFILNGAAVETTVAPHLTLVEVLRDHFDLFGARRKLRPGNVRLLHSAGRWPRGFVLSLPRRLRRRR